MEENKDKRSDSGIEDTGIDENTLIFRREPQTRQKMPQNGQSTPIDMQHTAQIQGGAVIRPLKKQSAQVPPQGNVPQQRPVAQMPPRSAPGQMQQQPGKVQNQRPVTPMPPRTAQGQMQQPGKVQNQRPVTSMPPRATQAQTQQRQSPTVKPLVRDPSSQQTPRSADTGRSSVAQGQNPPQKRQPGHPVQQTQKSSQIALPAQPKKRTENDDYEIDELTFTRETKQPKRDSAFVDSATSAIMSVVKAVVYIVAIIAVSVALSVFVINTGNDVFKFVVEDKLVTVNVPEYATIDDIADVLYDAGAIKYKWAFKLWSELKDSGAEFIPGTYEVSTALNYDYLRASFKEKSTNTEVRLTIPEGYTVDEIIDLFVENGIGTREGFVDAIQNYEFEYKFLENLTVSPDRIYRLEGYLFPDTYYFYQDSTEVTVLKKLLDNFNRKFVNEYYARCTDLGITVDEAIILASMVEKETRYADELGYVSSVFHNRLKYSASFPFLNSDATIMYAMQHDLGGRPDSMTGDDTSYVTPYNTYTNKGLPPGPIANPGLNSIKYALYPNDTKYFYFVSDSSGRTLFAETQQEHEANIIKARGN